DATTLSQAWGPPRDRGTTWSMFSAARLQYWHRWPSRAQTARRESGTRLRYGTRTKWCSRITDGTGSWARSECRTAPLRTTISAFSFSTRTTARRMGTTQSGSKLALSSRSLRKRVHLPRHLRSRARIDGESTGAPFGTTPDTRPGRGDRDAPRRRT